jgi:hypothetical protein
VISFSRLVTVHVDASRMLEYQHWYMDVISKSIDFIYRGRITDIGVRVDVVSSSSRSISVASHLLYINSGASIWPGKVGRPE